MRAKIEPAGYRLGNQQGAYRAALGDVAGGGILAALPIPLGSLIELLVPPHWPGQPEFHLLLWSRHLPSPRLGCYCIS
jgi:hypothetical protein